MSKPVVTFNHGHLVMWSETEDVARLYGVKTHPKLGDADSIRTSKVVSAEYKGDDLVRVETLNTIYERR